MLQLSHISLQVDGELQSSAVLLISIIFLQISDVHTKLDIYKNFFNTVLCDLPWRHYIETGSHKTRGH
jgi:hypothetical protein